MQYLKNYQLMKSKEFQNQKDCKEAKKTYKSLAINSNGRGENKGQSD